MFYIIRVFVHPFPGHEKGDFHVVLFQDGQDVAGVFIPPGRIKTQRYLFLLRIHAVDRKLLCFTGGRDGVGEKSASRKEEKGKGEEEEGVFYNAVDFGWVFVEVHGLPRSVILRIMYGGIMEIMLDKKGKVSYH